MSQNVIIVSNPCKSYFDTYYNDVPETYDFTSLFTTNFPDLDLSTLTYCTTFVSSNGMSSDHYTTTIYKFSTYQFRYFSNDSQVRATNDNSIFDYYLVFVTPDNNFTHCEIYHISADWQSVYDTNDSIYNTLYTNNDVINNSVGNTPILTNADVDFSIEKTNILSTDGKGPYETRIENNNTNLVQMQSDLETMQTKVNNLPKAAQPIYGSSIFTELDIFDNPGVSIDFVQDNYDAIYYILYNSKIIYKYNKSTQETEELFSLPSGWSNSSVFAIVDYQNMQCTLSLRSGQYLDVAFSDGNTVQLNLSTNSNMVFIQALKIVDNNVYVVHSGYSSSYNHNFRRIEINFNDHTASYNTLASSPSASGREKMQFTDELAIYSGGAWTTGAVYNYSIDTASNIMVYNSVFSCYWTKGRVYILFLNAYRDKILILEDGGATDYSGLYNITNHGLGSQIKNITELGLGNSYSNSAFMCGDNQLYMSGKVYSFDDDTNTFSQAYGNLAECQHIPAENYIFKKSDNTKLVEPTPNTNAQIGFVYGGTRYSLSRDYGVQNNRVVAGTDNVRDGYGDIVTGTMIDHGDLNIIPDTNGNTYNAGFYNSINVSAVNASIDANITANNIANGVDILGVIGTLDAGGGTNTMDANALANDIVQGKTAYVNGVKITGTVFEAVPGSFPMYGEATMFDMNYQHNAIVTSGYLPSGDGILMRGGVELGSIIYNNDMANALNLHPNQIANGVSIFGVNGELTPSGGYVNESQFNTICNTIAALNVPNMGVGFQDESGFTIRLQGFVNTSNSSNTQLFNAPSWLDAYEMYNTNILDISIDLVGNHADLFNAQTDASHFALYASNPTLLNNIPDSRFWLLGIANFSLLKEGYQNYIETTVVIDVNLRN